MIVLRIILYVFIALLALIVLLMFLRVKIRIRYDGDFSAVLKILFVRINIFPKIVKKVRVRDYSPARIKKRQEKARKKAEKKKAGKESRSEEKKSLLGYGDVGTLLSAVKEIVSVLFKYFFRYLRVDLSKLIIRVSADDAFKTSMLYGIIYKSVSYILALLGKFMNINTKRKSIIDVKADFLSGKTDADIDISFSIIVWQALYMLLKTMMVYLKTKRNDSGKSDPENTKEKDGKEQENVRKQ